MTQRYMHLSAAALDSAMRLLDEPAGRTTKLAVRQGFGPSRRERNNCSRTHEDLWGFVPSR